MSEAAPELVVPVLTDAAGNVIVPLPDHIACPPPPLPPPPPPPPLPPQD